MGQVTWTWKLSNDGSATEFDMEKSFLQFLCVSFIIPELLSSTFPEAVSKVEFNLLHAERIILIHFETQFQAPGLHLIMNELSPPPPLLNFKFLIGLHKSAQNHSLDCDCVVCLSMFCLQRACQCDLLSHAHPHCDSENALDPLAPISLYPFSQRTCAENGQTLTLHANRPFYKHHRCSWVSSPDRWTRVIQRTHHQSKS